MLKGLKQINIFSSFLFFVGEKYVNITFTAYTLTFSSLFSIIIFVIFMRELKHRAMAKHKTEDLLQ